MQKLAKKHYQDWFLEINVDQNFHKRLLLSLFEWFILSDCSIWLESNAKSFWGSVESDYDCLVEVKITMGKKIWDFDNWSLIKTGWPPNMVQLSTSLTVYLNLMSLDSWMSQMPVWACISMWSLCHLIFCINPLTQKVTRSNFS